MDKMVDGHREEEELERRGFTPKDVFGKEIRIKGKDVKIIDAGIEELYNQLQMGYMKFPGVDMKDVSECKKYIDKMWNE